MQGLSLDKILNELSAAGPETKTASEAKPDTTSKVAQTKADLVSALKRAEAASTGSAKTASAKSSPAAELTKVAADLAAADEEALVKEAQFYGAAIADGFMARLQQYEKIAEELPAVKTASANDVEKIASEAVRGYVETQNSIKLAAEQEYTRGFNETMQYCTKLASDYFGIGMQDCDTVLQHVQA